MVTLERNAGCACVLIVICALVFFNTSPTCAADPVQAPASTASDPSMSVPPALMKPVMSPLRKSAYATSAGGAQQPSGRLADPPTYVPMSSPADQGPQGAK